MALLELNQVSKEFGGLEALNQVSLTVNKGEIISLIGPNGAGKTTLFNCITGTMPPSAGTVRFNDKDITRLRPYLVARAGISRTFQHVRLFDHMSVLENVMVGNDLDGGVGIIGALLRPPSLVKKEKKSRERCIEVLSLFGERLLPRLDQNVNMLSYANRRRVEIARAVVSKPQLLLLDEPTAGMNPHETQGIVELIQLLRQHGNTLLIIEHKMKVVMTLSDKIIVLDHGEKIAEGLPDAIANNPEVVQAYMGGRHAKID